MRKYLEKLHRVVRMKEMRILPGHMSYFLVMSIMPLITLISFIASFFNLSITEVTEFALKFLPTEVANLIIPMLTNTNMSLNLILMFVGFYIVSNGMHSIILVSNTLYKTEEENPIRTRIRSLLLTIILMNLFFFTLVVMAFGNIIVKFILDLQIFAPISNYVYQLFVLLKYPFAFILIYFFIKTLYTLSPVKKIKSKFVTKGALFTTAGWIIVTAIYSYYANNIAHYDLFYGNISNLVVLLIWVYILSYIFVFGIGINVTEYELAENTTDKDAK